MEQPRRDEALKQRILRLLFPLAVVIAGFFLFQNAQVHWQYRHARQVLGKVVAAEYVKSNRSQASRIVVATGFGKSTVEATVDDIADAPDHLAPGASAAVLVNRADPHHVLFPSQLRWQNVALPGAIALLASMATVIIWLPDRGRSPARNPSTG